MVGNTEQSLGAYWPGPFPPAGQKLQRPLIQLVKPGFRGTLFKLDVAEPALDRELVPHDLLLIGEVLFLLQGRKWGEERSVFTA